MITLGIDEAGRGAVVGPLVMYGVATRSSDEDYLARSHIRDSKSYSNTAERTVAATAIKEMCCYHPCVAEASQVDEYVALRKLNVLERMMAENIVLAVADRLPLDRVVLDGHNLFDLLKDRLEQTWPKLLHKPEIIVTDKAEKHYIACAAASVCAKDHRDSRVHHIMGRHFEGGSGYPNAKTEEWINELVDIGGSEDYNENFMMFDEVAHNIRKSWKWKGLNKFKERLQHGR